MKPCTRCNINKPLSEFYKDSRARDGAQSACKKCFNISTEEVKLRKQAYLKKWRAENPDKVRNQKEKWYAENRQQALLYAKEYRQANSDKVADYMKDWRKKNRSKLTEYNKKLRETNPRHRLCENMRSRVNSALKLKGSKKSKRTMQYVGCTAEQLVKYLEAKFTPEMTWDNYGSYWHVDHIVPLSFLDPNSERSKNRLFHYTNLQPLKAIDNFKKGDNMSKDPNFQPKLERLVQDVIAELTTACDNYPKFNSPHEGYAILLEETNELWDLVKVKQSKHDLAHMRLECIQIAAMALRFALDLTGERKNG